MNDIESGLANRQIPNAKGCPDNVVSPSHYTQGHIEVIYIIEQLLGAEGFKAYCLGNYVKYKCRAEYKNGAEDLAKAEQYMEWFAHGLPKPVNGRVPREETNAPKDNAPFGCRFAISDCGRILLDYDTGKTHRIGDEVFGQEGHIFSFDVPNMVAIMSTGKKLPFGSWQKKYGS